MTLLVKQIIPALTNMDIKEIISKIVYQTQYFKHKILIKK